MEGSEIRGPWRATRLWNDIVRNFRSGMPIKRHRKGMKTYDNCFSSSDAVEWLHKNLQTNANFGAEVTRDQTVQLLKKLYRAGIIENAKEDGDDEFQEIGGLYRFSLRSPVKTPGKLSSVEKRRALADVGNTRMARSRTKVGEDGTPENQMPQPVRNTSSDRKREASRNRRETEAMKKRLNLSYFQALPANSLIILDNDDTWRSVFLSQLAAALSPHHVDALISRRCMDVSHVMHNMTKISAKGIVQLEEKADDLPHWVLSAMKCLANWPRQLKTLSGKESCLPNYPGFENDVFNVVKDYFLGLSGPLTTFPLYEYFIEAYVKAEAISAKPASGFPLYQTWQAGCHKHPHSIHNPCSRPFTQTDLDAMSRSSPQIDNFYTMDDTASDQFRLLSNQERIAKIRQTFEVLPPLSSNSRTTGTDNSNSTQWSCGQNTTFEGSGSQNSVLSPDMSTTAIMRTFLPPNTCFETAFMEESPITRIVPQKDNEILHLQRSGSGRSFTHIPNSWEVRSISTQTKPEGGAGKTEGNSSLKRLPKWRRNSRLRKSIAVMESPPEKKGVSGGMENKGFSDPAVSFNPTGLTPGLKRVQLGSIRDRQLYSTSDLPHREFRPSLRGFSSVDDLLSCRENMSEENFMSKYRQMKGDLRHNNNAFELSRTNEKPDTSYIPSKTVRKEKRKKKSRDASSDRESCEGITDDVNAGCYYNFGQVSPVPLYNRLQAPLATPEESALTPHHHFNRSSKYNASYRLANNHKSPLPHKRLAGLMATGQSHVTGGQSHMTGGQSHLTGGQSHVTGGQSHVIGGQSHVIGGQSHVDGGQNRVVFRRRASGGSLPSPAPRSQMPRTSTLINLPLEDPFNAAATQTPHSFTKTAMDEGTDDCLYVRAEPYLNSDASQCTMEPTYASMNHGIYSQTNLGEVAHRQHLGGGFQASQGPRASQRCVQGPHSDSTYHSTRRPLVLSKPAAGSNYQSIRRPPVPPNSAKGSNYSSYPSLGSSNLAKDPVYGYPSSMPTQESTYAPSTLAPMSREAVYTSVGPGPIRRYTVPPETHQIDPPQPRRPDHQTRLERPDVAQNRRRSRSSEGRIDEGALSRRNTIRASRCSGMTADSGRFSSASNNKACSAGQPSPMHQSMDDELYATARSHQSNSTADTSGSLPPRGISAAVESFRLLGLLLPPPNRRKLQLLLKFIKKIKCNNELDLGPDINSLAMNTFLDVTLRPKEFSSYDPDLARKVLQFFLDHYDEVWTPPQSLRKEVEERVYQSLVNRRIQAGEDPYPVTYCEQVTLAEYEKEKLTGAQTALVDLLDAILVDSKLSPNDKKKKLKKFKTSYEDIWRRKFPSEEKEPEYLHEKKEKKGKNKFSSLSRIRSVVGI